MLIRNLNGLFSCRGFGESQGRRPTAAQADFIRGPVDIYCDQPSGRILEVARNLTPPSDVKVLDGSGKIAVPGFVDSHTHAIFAGSRAPEYFRRWSGQSYVQIAKSGGGIAFTQRKTTEASDRQLTDTLAARFKDMLATGTVAVEVKSGYGQNVCEELRMLRIIRAAAAATPQMRVAATFLGLHSLPEGRTEKDYTEEMISALGQVKNDGLADSVDSFPETHFFSLASALRFSESARQLGLRVRVHAEELSNLGTAEEFLKIGASSIDHLQHISDTAISELADSNTVATLLPATSFFLDLPYADARKLVQSGAKVALATDFNPGTAPSSDLRLTILLAASRLKMTSAEILCGLTCNGAQSLGLNADFGSVEAGKSSKFLLCKTGEFNSTEPSEILDYILLSGAFYLAKVGRTIS